MAGYRYLCNETILKIMRFFSLHCHVLYAPRLPDLYFW